MPHDFPPWGTIHHYYRVWTKLGVFERINAKLVEVSRIKLGRAAEPSLGTRGPSKVALRGARPCGP